MSVGSSAAQNISPDRSSANLDQRASVPALGKFSPLGLGTEVFDALGAAIYFRAKKHSEMTGRFDPSDLTCLSPVEQRTLLPALAIAAANDIHSPQPGQSKPSLRFILQLALDGVPVGREALQKLVGLTLEPPHSRGLEQTFMDIRWLCWKDASSSSQERFIECAADFERPDSKALAQVISDLIVTRALSEVKAAMSLEHDGVVRFNTEIEKKLNALRDIEQEISPGLQVPFETIGTPAESRALLLEYLSRQWITSPRNVQPEIIRTFKLTADERRWLALRMLDNEQRSLNSNGKLVNALVILMQLPRADSSNSKESRQCQEIILDTYVNMGRSDWARQFARGLGLIRSETSRDAYELELEIADRILSKSSKIPAAQLNHTEAINIYDRYHKNVETVPLSRVEWIKEQLKIHWPLGLGALFLRDIYGKRLYNGSARVSRRSKSDLVSSLLTLGVYKAAYTTAKHCGVDITPRMLKQAALAMLSGPESCSNSAAQYMSKAMKAGEGKLLLRDVVLGASNGLDSNKARRALVANLATYADYIDFSDKEMLGRQLPGSNLTLRDFLVTECVKGIADRQVIRPWQALKFAGAMGIPDRQFVKELLDCALKGNGVDGLPDRFLEYFYRSNPEAEREPRLAREDLDRLGKWLFYKVLSSTTQGTVAENVIRIRLETMFPRSPGRSKDEEHIVRLQAAALTARRFNLLEQRLSDLQDADMRDSKSQQEGKRMLGRLAEITLKIQNRVPVAYPRSERGPYLGSSAKASYRIIGTLHEFACRLCAREDLQPFVDSTGNGRINPLKEGLSLLGKIEREETTSPAAVKAVVQGASQLALDGQYDEAIARLALVAESAPQQYIDALRALGKYALINAEVKVAERCVNIVGPYCRDFKLKKPADIASIEVKSTTWKSKLPREWIEDAVAHLSASRKLPTLLALEHALQKASVRENRKLFTVPLVQKRALIAALAARGEFEVLHRAHAQNPGLGIATFLNVEEIQSRKHFFHTSPENLLALAKLKPEIRHNRALSGWLRANSSQLTAEMLQELVDSQEYSWKELFGLLFEGRSGLLTGSAEGVIAGGILHGSYVAEDLIQEGDSTKIKRLFEMLLSIRPERLTPTLQRLVDKGKLYLGEILADAASDAFLSGNPQTLADFERTLRETASWCGDERFRKIYP